MDTRKLMVDGLLEYIGQAGEEQQLPAGYVLVEWLSSKGAAKIDTGISGANNNLKIEMRFKYDGYASYKSFYGTYTNEYTDCTRRIRSNSDNEGLYACLHSTAGGGLRALLPHPKPGWHDFWMTKAQTSLDGVVVATTGASGTAASPTQTIKLFTHSATASDTACTVYMSAFRIWNNGSLVRNFIPAVRIADMKPGMYETVGSQFYTNIGTGEDFGYAGELHATEYRRVEYLESRDSYQAIDPLISFFDRGSTRVQIDIEHLNLVGRNFVIGDVYNGPDYTTRTDGYLNLELRYDAQIRLYPAVESSGIYVNTNRNVWGLTWNNGIVDVYLNGVKQFGSDFWIPTGRQALNQLLVTDGRAGAVFGSQRIRVCTCEESGSLTRMLIPTVRQVDSKPGLYDTVNNVFHTNIFDGVDFTWQELT